MRSSRKLYHKPSRSSTLVTCVLVLLWPGLFSTGLSPRPSHLPYWSQSQTLPSALLVSVPDPPTWSQNENYKTCFSILVLEAGGRVGTFTHTSFILEIMVEDISIHDPTHRRVTTETHVTCSNNPIPSPHSHSMSPTTCLVPACGVGQYHCYYNECLALLCKNTSPVSDVDDGDEESHQFSHAGQAIGSESAVFVSCGDVEDITGDKLFGRLHTLLVM